MIKVQCYIYFIELKQKLKEKGVDKQNTLMYNNFCVTKAHNKILVAVSNSEFWRNTQEAEEAPLLRV